MNDYKKMKQLLDCLIENYLVKRNIDQILSIVSEKVIWVDSYQELVARNKEELKLILEQGNVVEKIIYHIGFVQKTIRKIANDVYEIFLTEKIQTYKDSNLIGDMQIMIYCGRTNEEWEIMSFFVSINENSLIIHKNSERLNDALIGLKGGISICELGEQIKLISVPDEIIKMLGYQPKDLMLVKTKIEKFMAESEQVMLQHKVTEARKTKNNLKLAVRLKCRSGGYKWVSYCAHYIGLSQEGNPIYYGLVLDVNEQYILYEKVMSETTSGMFMMDVESYEMYFVNDKLFEMFHIPKEEYIGKKCHEVLLHKDQPCVSCRLRKQEINQSFLSVTPNGRTMEITLSQIDWMGQKSCIGYAKDVTEDIKSKQLVELERDRYRIVVEHRGITLFDLDHQSGEAYYSEGYQNYAISRQKIEVTMNNQGSIDMVHPDDVPELFSFFKEAEKKVDYSTATLRVKMIDGTYRWNIMSGFYLYDESGNKIRSIGTFEDIHEKKMSELERQGIYDMEMNQSLKLQDDLVGRVIVNVTKDFIIDYGKKSRRFIVPKQPSIKVFNEHIKKIVTHPEEQKKIDMAMSREAFLNAYQQGKEMVVKYSFLGDNHRMTYLQSKTKFVKHPKTDDLIAFINVYDVTKKEIYDRVIEKAVHTNYDVLVAIHTDDEQIELMIGDEYHNKHYVQNKSYSECLQSISKWLKQPEEKENYLSANSIKTIQSKLNLENEYMFSGVFVDPDRKREVRKLLRYQYLDQTKCIILATCEDVTSLYDKEIAQKRELIETLNKLKKASQAKNEFFSAISHDIRTPLNAVIGMTQLAMEDETNAKQVHESLEVICNASKQLLSLINDILDISQMESNKIVLNDNIFSHQEETSKLISKAALLTKEKNQCLHTLIQVEHDMCIGDNIRIHRIMDNLISNAVKYTPVGGDIRFEVTEESSAMSEFAEYSFIIEDNGIGMSEEIQKRIFEPFYHFSYETIGQDEGIGLGLSIVKESVDLMNGTIEMTSKVGEGSKFQVRIPIRIAKKQQTVVQKPEESIKEKTKEDIKESEKENTEENIKKQPADWMERCKEKDIRVLVVEDHPINQLIIERMLENKEIPVTIAKNGEEGVRYFEEATIHPYTHILMDVQMPVMNGYEATKAIRNSNHPQAKLVTIIAMTAYAFHEDVTACLEAGMDAHLAKPVNMEQLYRMLYESASDKNSE